jgi:hypothetical protein
MQNPRSDSQTESHAESRPRRLVFIDDSGDPGFDFEKGSSRYLVIAGVSFDSSDDANTLKEKIRVCKMRIGLPENYELKFSAIKKRYVKTILSETSLESFWIETLIVDKYSLQESKRQIGKESLYNYAIKEFLARIDERDNCYDRRKKSP